MRSRPDLPSAMARVSSPARRRSSRIRRAREKGGPGAGQCNAALGPLEQDGAEVLFEIADAAAQMWLGNAEPPGGAAEMQVLGEDDETAQPDNIHIDTDSASISVYQFIGRLLSDLHTPDEKMVREDR